MTDSPRRAVLLVNLGSPDSPSVPDVRRYLREFLSDDRVLDAPKIIQQFVLNCIILPFRPKKSAEAYATIWKPEGSPLVLTSIEVQRLLAERVPYPVFLAMRYGKPSIPSVVADILRAGITELFLVPLYPHYAMSSYETVVVAVRDALREQNARLRLITQQPFYDDPRYIAAMVENAREHLAEPYDHLLFSYHGIPERHLRKGDASKAHCLSCEDCCEMDSPAHAMCYRAQTRATTRAFVKAAGIADGKWSISYQSRLGRDPWLKPYTDFELARLPKEGIRNLLVISPAFVSDCLETLEEIHEQGKETFVHAGGERYRVIPCLNTHPHWLSALESFTQDALPHAELR
jgi:ferrochelatase